MSSEPTAATPSSVSAPAADSVTMEQYELLKKQLEQKSADLADARARTDVFEAKERTRIAAFQPEAVDFMKTMMEDADAETKADLGPLQEWAGEFHQKADILAQAPLARLVSCASAKLKRTREEASVNSEASATLANSMMELETAKAERDQLRQRVGELESLAGERQEGLEKLQEELAKAGLMQDKWNFSKLTSREKGAAGVAVNDPKVAAAAADADAAAAGVKAVVSNASKGNAAARTDGLLADILSRGSGGLRVSPSGTSHAFVGNNSSDGDLIAALRGAQKLV